MEFIARRDSNDRFRFAELGSHHANQMLEEHGVDGEGVDSVVVITSGAFVTHSCAVVAICESLGGPYKILGSAIRFVPKSFRDAIYGVIAKNRMILSKNGGLCEARSSRLANKFLEERGR